MRITRYTPPLHLQKAGKNDTFVCVKLPGFFECHFLTCLLYAELFRSYTTPELRFRCILLKLSNNIRFFLTNCVIIPSKSIMLALVIGLGQLSQNVLICAFSFQAGNPGGPGPGGRGRGRGQGNWNMGPPGGLQEFNFIVPTGKTGLIIGKGNVSYIYVCVSVCS